MYTVIIIDRDTHGDIAKSKYVFEPNYRLNLTGHFMKKKKMKKTLKNPNGIS